MSQVTEHMRDVLLEVAKEKKVYLEGNFLKLLKAPPGDTEFKNYLELCKKKDTANRRKRLDVTKQVQQQNKELEAASIENIKVNKELESALNKAIISEDKAKKEKVIAEAAKNEADKLKIEAEQAREVAQTDLSLLQKKTQTELMSSIVKVALWVIMGVGLITTGLYVFVVQVILYRLILLL